MTTWIVRNRATGETAYAYTGDDAAHFAEFPLDTYNHIREMDLPPAAPQGRRITRLAFRNRFAQAEKVAIEIAALDNPAATMAQRAAAAGLRAYNADVNAAQFVDLDRPDTRAGVQALEAFGLIAAGRAFAVLDTPPTASELFTD